MEAVRAAAAADLPRCVELVTEASLAADSARGGRLLATLGGFGGLGAGAGAGAAAGVGTALVDPGQLVGGWLGAGTTTSSTLLVGTIDDVVVGLAAGTVVSGDRTVGRIECCYVEPAARGVGVGSGLVTALVAWFGERECSDVDALALPGDRSMKQLLEATGFKTRLLVLHRSPS
ncbi:MAG TPA: GNAT family N-acetyltransferase [Acidimicrobiales bacterium]|nr:GNAT family N-acetyltransferase [Acidimicrobiales bacterium]